jgi:CheY-like chemotaxis protein
MGAFAFFRKPAERTELSDSIFRISSYLERRKKSLLIVEDQEAERSSLVELLSGDDIETRAVGSGAEALELLHQRPFDCLVLDLRLPDITGADLIARIKAEVELQRLPIIVHTGKSLSPEEEEHLKLLSSAVIIKDANSPERILEEVSLFLHRPAQSLAASGRRMLESVVQKDEALGGKTVLVVDDDMRNIYALSSILENSDLNVVYATNGRKAIEELKSNGDIDLVLMDIMMPEMDGYQAMREIRKTEEFKELPIIALTAKAMKGDRERCIEAGASDYIPKPVDPERLLSLLRVWLYTEANA